MSKRRSVRLLLVLLTALCAACLLAGVFLCQRCRGPLIPPPLPALPIAAPYTPWSTPPVADQFDAPLQPTAAFGPLVAPPLVDTRYGAQNPAMGERANCFRDADGNAVPFDQLYHAGVDLFALDERGRVVAGAAHQPVHAVADGLVLFVVDAGADGQVIIAQHRLPDQQQVYSVYWHVDHVQVDAGQPVTRGQVIAVVRNTGYNSHLHWEMRTFDDGSQLFPPGTAGARGTCNGHTAGVGYTWDDDPAQATPDRSGYLDPLAFVQNH